MEGPKKTPGSETNFSFPEHLVPEQVLAVGNAIASILNDEYGCEFDNSFENLSVVLAITDGDFDENDFDTMAEEVADDSVTLFYNLATRTITITPRRLN